MKIVNDLNLKKQADELGVKVWQTPSFLFAILGLINISAMTATYFLAKSYNNPEVLVLAESVVTSVIFIVGKMIISSIEQVAKVNKVKSEFVALASHQLRTPLSAIRWEIELLNSKFKKDFKPSQLKRIENILSMANRMTKIVNDLLDVAKIDQKKLILRKERVNLVEVLDEAREDFSSVLDFKEINLKFNNTKKEAFVLGDPEKIKLVIENILSNSVKYSKKQGKIEVTVKKSKAFWVCTIKDDGIGIPKSQQRQVFDKFFRSYNVFHHQAEGSGLGLYIVKNIIENLGGRVWFKSEENIGSIFNFSLPMA
jgi:signal transduction histidine kinase